tara:strand:- start:6 stop:500 length:495 start_codon:yes stop_codon:yes gene_type:complete|eukprot:scaffold108615_cov69-Phaeocystis_antarctica.AAC.1
MDYRMRSRVPITTTLLVALVGGASGWAAQPHFRQQHRRAELSMSLQATPITRLGLVPPGPDPYKLVRDDIELIKSSIKKMLSTNKGTGASLAQNEVLTMAAREFTARQGKSYRRMVKAPPATAPEPGAGASHGAPGISVRPGHANGGRGAARATLSPQPPPRAA